MHPSDVPRLHECPQPVARVIRQLDGLLLRVEGGHGQHRPEHLVLGQAVERIHVGQQGWLDEVSTRDLLSQAGAGAMPADNRACAYVVCPLEDAQDTVVRRPVHDWPYRGPLVQRVA